MKRLRFLVPVLGLSSLVAVACGDDTDVGEGGAGAGGEAAGGEGPAPGPGGGGGEETGVGGGCAEDGTGTVVVEVEGLPEGVDADISITGPDELAYTTSDSIEGVNAGTYTVTAGRVFDADERVRTVFDATVTAPDFCLADGDSHTISVTYEAIPSSNKLWLGTGTADELGGFTSQVIAESGITDASVAIHGPGANSVAFDQDGNLWAIGPTVADAQLARFAAADLGASGTREPDVAFNVPEIGCLVAINHIAFDAGGNLWLSACGDEIYRIPAADLLTGGDTKVSDVLITGLTNNSGLAFDADGNLWVAGGPALVRYDAARLDTPDGDPADLSITITSAASNMVLGVDELAFDADGNLWGVSGDNLFQLAVADLTGTGDQAVKAAITFTMTVLGLPSTPAFDDGGGLWISLDSGNFGRYSPAQLGMSSGTGMPIDPDVVINSTSVASTLPMAFFPAPAGLPLYHSIP